MPPIRCSASFAAGISSSQGRMNSAVPTPTAFAVIAPIEHEARAPPATRASREQVVQLQHLDAALLHLQHEVVVVLLRLLHPDHVVEQQVVAVAGRQALVREPGPADHARCAACRPPNERRADSCFVSSAGCAPTRNTQTGAASRIRISAHMPAVAPEP